MTLKMKEGQSMEIRIVIYLIMIVVVSILTTIVSFFGHSVLDVTMFIVWTLMVFFGAYRFGLPLIGNIRETYPILIFMIVAAFLFIFLVVDTLIHPPSTAGFMFLINMLMWMVNCATSLFVICLLKIAKHGKSRVRIFYPGNLD